MKGLYLLTLLGVSVLASCSQHPPVVAVVNHGGRQLPAEPLGGSGQYVALPGQETARVGNSSADEVFNQYATNYGGGRRGHRHTRPQYDPRMEGNHEAPAEAPLVQTPHVETPRPVVTPPPVVIPEPKVELAQNLQPSSFNTSVHTGKIDYKVNIINQTPNRLFIEAHDEAGTMYPCGGMTKGQTSSSAQENAKPIRGPITVVLRDPDQDGAPEIRRFKIPAPTSSYAGKAVNIKIFPGGKYSAAVEKEVYAAVQ